MEDKGREVTVIAAAEERGGGGKRPMYVGGREQGHGAVTSLEGTKER